LMTWSSAAGGVPRSADGAGVWDGSARLNCAPSDAAIVNNTNSNGNRRSVLTLHQMHGRGRMLQAWGQRAEVDTLQRVRDPTPDRSVESHGVTKP
jgi:hypothetical protein